ncbi:MAG: aminotransferase class V-fold PLP-dependent enzyme [Acidobacteria bacterium]|nr:aminotransferase class V-fold PLP-dependent enzyme [Acidobacteriota bacterium]
MTPEPQPWAHEFDQIPYRAYLNHAASTPSPKSVCKAIQEYAATFSHQGARAWPKGLAIKQSLRQKLAQLVHATDAEIGLTLNTSHGLMVVAQEFPWSPGDGIVLVKNEFPANVVPWLQAARNHGLRVHWLELDDIRQETQAFHRVMAAKPKLLAISWVQYQTGQAVSLAQLSKVRADYGVAICLDAIQGLVPLTMDLKATAIDFVAAGGHKWLMGPEGIGFLYINHQWAERLNPGLVNWLSQTDPVDFLVQGPGLVNYDKPFRQTADHIEFGTSNNLGAAGLEAAVSLILKIGPDIVASRIQSSAQYTWQQLIAQGIQAIQPHAGIVSVPFPTKPQPIITRLAEHGVIAGSPDGHIRFSPHIHNTEPQIQWAVEQLAKSFQK